MKIRVIVTHLPPLGHYTEICPRDIVADFIVDHDDPVQRRVLGEQCRNAFDGGQTVTTFPIESALARIGSTP